MVEPISVTVGVAATKLVLNAIWHSPSIKRTLNVWFKPREARRAVKRIHVKQAILRETIKSILLPYAGHDEAARMLSEPESALWHESDFQDYLAERMGDVASEVQECLELINEDLAQLEECALDSGLAKVERQSNTHEFVASNHRTFRQRTNHALSRSSIEALLQELDNDIEDLAALLSSAQPTKSNSTPALLPDGIRMEVTRCNNIKNFALDLYQALGMVCREHSEHRFALSLSSTSARQRAEFTLMYKQPLGHKPHEGPPKVYNTRFVHLKIESAVAAVPPDVREPVHVADSSIQSEFLRTQKRHRERSPRPKKLQKMARKVAFQTTDVSQATAPSTHEHRSSYLSSDLYNFCAKQDFCDHIRGLLDNLHTTYQPIGYLDCVAGTKHMLYLKLLDPPMGADPRREKVQPLTQLLNASAVYQSRYLQIPIQQRARIGKQLATALLQYNSTPWLTNSLSSQHLLVDCDDADGDGEREDDSYLDVSIKSMQDQINDYAEGSTAQISPSQQTFNLGVMLLELALHKPLQEMRRMRDTVPSSEAATNYRTADRLQRRVAQQAGSQFAMVVGRCIHWDACYGPTLNTSKLQAAFYQDVIQELNDVEQICDDMRRACTVGV